MSLFVSLSFVIARFVHLPDLCYASKMRTFVGRQGELARLRAAYDDERSELICIYGRRRVGKTALIRRSLEDRPAVYMVGKTAPAAFQLREFLRQAARELDAPLLATYPAAGWRDALEQVLTHWPVGRKVILVFDEFQWIAGASPALPSLFQELWDQQWRASGSITVVLCSSQVGFMERKILGRTSPLSGRPTAQLELKPFGFREAAAFHPRWSHLEHARAYFVCGGIPWYLRLFDPDDSVDTNIRTQLLSEHAPLHHEPQFLLREELREVDTYYAVLTTIAGGNHMHSKIATAAGLEARALPYYLQQLSELGYIERVHPLTGRAPAARHVRYRLADPLLRFWFRFVFPNLSELARHGSSATFRAHIKPELAAYEASCFERLCREALPRLYAESNITARAEVGEYWSKTAEIDVVGRRDDGWLDLGECKWGAVRSLPRLAAELEAKIPAYPNRSGSTIGRWLFLEKRPAKSRLPVVPNARWIGLSELYGTGRRR